MTRTDEAPDRFRWDELTGSWVVVAPSRRGAGASLTSEAGAGLPTISGRCPFCPGNESDTEAPIAVFPEGEADAWRVRVVANKYPLARAGAAAVSEGAFLSAAAAGAHEVIVESPEHDADFGDFTPEHARDVLRVYRDRVVAVGALEGVRAVSAFRNRGRRAGSSQPHPHGQIIGAPVVGPFETARDRAAHAFWAERGTTLLESVLERELTEGERLVDVRDDFVVLCPWAPHQNHQTWIVPRDARGSFARIDDALLAPLAETLQRTLRALRVVTGGMDYNLSFRLPTVEASSRPYAFWYLDVLPRRGGGAGFEITSGIDVVTVSPERAAADMRAIVAHG